MWERATDYLFNQRPAFERQGAAGYKPGLETSLALDRMYKEPHRNYRIIHIAGTNGKGSTAHMLASCLQRCGYRVGLFTSPHLVDFRERIRVNGHKISRSYVLQWVADYRKNPLEDYEPSFFELTSTMAFDYFAWRHVNVAVVETGLGGRLDSTNIVTPDLSIITNIGLEHQQFLGNTVGEIAFEKAGIMKHGKPVVIGRAEGVVRDVFEATAKRLYCDIKFAQDKPQVLSAKHIDGMLRLTTQDYGIIPTVKLNEEQSQYYSVVHDIATLQCVPTTCTKLEAVSAVLEEMAYESYLSVTPSYYETALKTKYTRDNLSSQIIDLLHDTAMTDMAYIYQDAFSSVGYAGRNLIASKKSDLASWYAKKEKAALKNMQKLIDKYTEMG